MIHIYLQLPDDTYFSDPPSYTWGPDTKRLEKCIRVYQGEKKPWPRMESSRALFCRSSPLIAENTPQTRGGSCLLFILCLLWLAPEHIHMHFTFTRMMFRSCVEHSTSRWSKGALFAAARAHVSCMEALWSAHNQRNCAENLIRRYFYCSLRAAASRLVSWNSTILMIQHTFTFSILIKTLYR